MKWNRSRSETIKNSLAAVVVLLIGVIGIALLSGSRAATGANLSLSAPSASVAPGSTFSVTIKEDSGTDPINSVQASLNYDASQLQFVSITEGTAFPTVAATSTTTAGVIRVGRATSTPVTGVQNVVTVNFKVLAASGSIDLSFDKNFSFLVRSTDNTDVLLSTTGSTTPVTGAATSTANMTLTPAAISGAVGSTVTVTVREDSGTALVNSVQSSVSYDATKLQFTGITEGTTFTNSAATDTATAGKVRVARSVQAGSAGISGNNPIVTISFKVLATSGTSPLTIDKAQSFVVSSASNTDILGTVAGATLTVTASPTTPSTLSLSPTTGTYTKDSTISVSLKASSAAKLTTVQATLNYPAAQLQFVSVTEGNVFTTAQRTTTATAGTIDLIRSIPGGNVGVTGENPVVTLTFKVLGTSGSAPITFTNTSALYDDSGTGTNILNLAGSTTANYTLAPSTVTPPPPPPPVGNAAITLAPPSGSFTQNSNVSVAVKVNSTTSAITTVQSVLNYPATQLQFVSATNGTVFTTAQRTTTTSAGVVDIIRSIAGGSAGVTGENTVVTVTFKVIGTGGTAAITLGTASAVFDDSGTGTNILNRTTSAGATYTIAAAPTCSTNPSAPGTPTRTANNYTTVTLNWAASAAGANCTLAGYHVFRNGTLVGDVTSGTSFTDSGLTSGTAYNYTVSAFDTAGHTSALSAAASLTSKADDMAPTTPVGFTAVSAGVSSINLAWTPSTDFPNPGGIGIQGYKIYRNGTAVATYTVATGTTFVDSNVTGATTYTYTVTAFDKLGNESAPSNIASAKTDTPTPVCTGNPTTPSALTAGTSTLTTTSLGWSASTPATACAIAGYRIFRNSVQVGTATATVTTYQDSGLAPNTSYNYTVQAFDSNGHSSGLSTARTIATLADTTAPSAPTAVTAVAPTAGQVSLAWAGSTDNVAVTGYRIYRGGTLISTTNAAARNYNDTTVTGNTAYAYTVSAIDAAGNETVKVAAAPNPVRTPAAPDTQAPSAPARVRTLTVTTSSAVLTWDASTDNTAVTGYHVYRFGVFVGDATGLTYTDTSLADNTPYTYTVKAFDASGNNSAASAALTFTTPKVIINLIGDLNIDGSVDVFDLSIMMSHWREVNVPLRFGDINQDAKVDISDLSILLSHLGEKL